MQSLLLPKYIRLDCPIVSEVAQNYMGNKSMGCLDAHSIDLYIQTLDIDCAPPNFIDHL